MNPGQRIRRARRALYLVTSLALALFGILIVVMGTVSLFESEGKKVLFWAVGLVGIWLWLRWDDKRALSEPSDENGRNTNESLEERKVRGDSSKAGEDPDSAHAKQKETST